MNKLLPVLLGVIALALGAALYHTMREADSLRAQLSELQAKSEAKLVERQAEVTRLQEQNEVFKSESTQLREKLATVAKSAANPSGADGTKGDGKKEDGNWMKGFTKMFNDPEMKKAMRSQQSFGVRMMYGDLAKELGLTTEEANLVLDLIVDRQMAVSSKTFGADGDASKLEANAAEAQKVAADYEAEMKNMLGDERMKKFQQYERTTGERMSLQQYQQSLASAGMPLDDGQRQSLLDIMVDERLKQPPSALEPGNKDVAGAMKAMQSGEAFDRMMTQQRELNQRVLTKARALLSADQTNALETAQKQFLDMQEMGMKMGKAMMSGGNTDGGAKK
jgi:uncharacterized protein YbaA (DUF1428 family)